MKIIKPAIFIFIFITITTAVFAQTDSTISIKANGACGQCKIRIEKALKVPGIKKANWDVRTQMVTVNYDAAIIHAEELHTRIAAAGHDTELKKAKDHVYDQLPECCLFRDPALAAFADTARNSEHYVHGLVLSEDNKGNIAPLSGASIFWQGTRNGARTDVHGIFSIPYMDKFTKLVVSYAGMESDTVDVENVDEIQVILASHAVLHEVRITSKERTTFINNFNPFRVETITAREL